MSLATACLATPAVMTPWNAPFRVARRASVRLLALPLFVVLGLAACQAQIGSTDNPGGGSGASAGTGAAGGTAAGTVPGGGASGGGGGSQPQPPAVQPGPSAFGTCPKNGDPGATPLRKLSTLQYRNTVADLLAQSGVAPVATEVQATLAGVPDDSPITFRGLDSRISLDHIQGYFNVAVAVADALTSTPARLTTVAGACASTAPLAATCVDQFLGRFGRRAFRRPLDAAELTSFRQLNDGVRPPAEAIRAMILTLLISPRFVNHLEIDGAPIAARTDYLQLDPYEVASRLSYTFWQSMPDDALMTSAQDGSLATDAGFATQLDRVFTDPRTQQTLWQFWNEWLRLDSFTGFAAERPAFQALAAGQNINVAGHDHYGDMVREVRDLTELFTWKQRGTLADLLTSDVSVTRSADLARLYGVPAWTGTGDYPRFTGGTRAGLLQRAALLVSSLEQTNPFHRGSLIRRAILCDALAQPDANTLPPGSLDPPPPSAAESTRTRFTKKVAGNALCAGCHSQFSDIGYVLEAYDALGRFRTTEKVYDEQTGRLLADLPLDTTAVARVTPADARPVAGPVELNQRIAESGKVDACLSANYFRYGLRREPTAGSADACDFEVLRTRLSTPGAALADVFKELAAQPSFRRRKVGAQ